MRAYQHQKQAPISLKFSILILFNFQLQQLFNFQSPCIIGLNLMEPPQCTLSNSVKCIVGGTRWFGRAQCHKQTNNLQYYIDFFNWWQQISQLATNTSLNARSSKNTHNVMDLITSERKVMKDSWRCLQVPIINGLKLIARYNQHPLHPSPTQ